MSKYKLLNHPYVQQALQSKDLSGSEDLEKDVKVPYIMKDKVLMAPGVWNNYFYTPDSVSNAYNQTDWEDKEIRSLFLDHEDKNAREWVGEVRNARMVGEQVLGDLHIVDKSTAMKLAFGAKMGISPKVTGEEENGTMLDFLFDNFSVVINPAVKKAYINNSQHDAPVSKELGELQPKMDVTSKPESKDATASEVNQMAKETIEPTSAKMEEEAAPAPEPKEEEAPKEEAKPEGEDKPKEAEEKMEEEEAKPEEKSEELHEFTSFAENFLAENKGKSITEAMAAYEEHKKDPVMARISSLEAANKALAEKVNELSEKLSAKDVPKVEEKKEELSEKKEDAEPEKVTQEMSQKTEQLDKVAPAPVGKRTNYMSETSAKDSDHAFLEMLKAM